MTKLLLLLLVLCFNGSARADFANDQAECTNQLMGLATCLTYVEGNAKAPTPDCCNGLKQLLSKGAKCLCVLIKDRNEPELGIKMNISLAILLPSVCHLPANISKCPKILNLPPNSKEAQIFKQSGIEEAKGISSTSDTGKDRATSTHASGCARSDYYLGKKMRLFGMKRIGGVWLGNLAILLLHVLL